LESALLGSDVQAGAAVAVAGQHCGLALDQVLQIGRSALVGGWVVGGEGI